MREIRKRLSAWCSGLENERERCASDKQKEQEKRDKQAEAWLQAVSEAEEWDGRDEDAWHVVLYDAAAPPACVACARLLVDEGGQAAAVGRVAVARSQRERGVGSLLMARVHELALGRLGLLSLRLDAQVQVIPFYEKMGYSLVPGEVFLDAGIPHRKMLLKN